MCLLYNNFSFISSILDMYYKYILNNENNENNENKKLYDSDDDIDVDTIIENISKNKEILVNEYNELLLLENKDENIIIEKYNEYTSDNDDFIYIK